MTRDQLRRGRTISAGFLAVCVVGFAWVYTGYLGGERTPNAAFILPVVAPLALGGLLDPRLLWSVGPRRHAMPDHIRRTGAVLFGIGIALAAAFLLVPDL